MAATKERIKTAKDAAFLIDLIAKKIMKNWEMTFSEIQETGKEAEFDREIIKFIYLDSAVKEAFEASKSYTKDNFGIVWECFTEDQKNIIALKETKLW
jgi:hypothetical protein